MNVQTEDFGLWKGCTVATPPDHTGQLVVKQGGHAAVVVGGAAQNLDVGFLEALECVDHCKEFCQVVNLFSFTRIAV